jgi:hypothetical protein
MKLESNGNTGAPRVNNYKRAIVLGILGALSGAAPLWSQSTALPLDYHGGPVLESFTIYPLYYGSWATQDITKHQNYLMALASYMSGQNAPVGQEPATRQYGVNAVKIAAYTSSSAPALSPHPLTPAEVLEIIHTNQTPTTQTSCRYVGAPKPLCTTQTFPAKLPAYSRNTLLVVFLGKGFNLGRGPGVGYHSSESTSSFFAFLPYYGVTNGKYDVNGSFDVNSLELVTAHEVLEAATDPAGYLTLTNGTEGEVHNGNEAWLYYRNGGWAEAVDQCNTTFSYSVGATSWTITGVHDNTQYGSCSTTGYTARPFPLPAHCGLMYANQALIANTPREQISSCDGRFSLKLEEHGYLALEANAFGGSYLWNSSNISSDFSAKSGVMALMQGDGNLVVYRGFEPDSANAVWSTNTWGHPGAYLAIQNDGNLVVYTADGKGVLWASNSCCH